MSGARYWLIGVAVLFGSTAFGTTMSPNLIVGGDFESLSAIKTLDSPRTQAEINAGAPPVRSWQFHPGGIAAEATAEYSVGQSFSDFGKWIGAWGISTNDDPRALYNQTGDNGAPNNVSTVAGNRYLEGVYFRSWAAQVVKAPARHVAGPATINFDYYFNQWTAAIPPVSNDANSIFHVWVGGINDEDLPAWTDRAGPAWGGALDGDPEYSCGGPWTLNPLWSSPNFDSQPWGWSGIGSDQAAVGSQGELWHSLSASFPSSVSFTISQPYDNYYVSVWQTVYSEGHEYYWMYAGKPSDQLAVAIDNVDLRVSVGPQVLMGDCNFDGMVNALDISCFVDCLIKGCSGSCDLNGDGLCNALDISPFVQCLVSGSCGGEVDGNAVPEPAAITLVALAIAGCWYRRK